MVYQVNAVELSGGERTFEWTSKKRLKKGARFYHDEFMTAYRVRRVVPDDTGLYSGIVEADAEIGPPVTDS